MGKRRLRHATLQWRENFNPPVLVPWGAGAEILAALRARHAMREEIQLLRRAQAYTVNLDEGAFRRLSEKGAIEAVGEGCVYALREGVYSEEAGAVTTQEMST